MIVVRTHPAQGLPGTNIVPGKPAFNGSDRLAALQDRRVDGDGWHGLEEGGHVTTIECRIARGQLGRDLLDFVAQHGASPGEQP